MSSTSKDAPEQSPAQLVAPPVISLPKGGGAIRGIGEKFSANPVTGTGAMSVPITTSAGRSGFGPQLSLSYDSGAGNGPFGFGWSLSLPSITRKTDKGLPRYRDADESDVFILSGAEDLVPATGEVRTVDGVVYRIERYRPRIEGLFSRIERWTNVSNSETHWRSISRDNVTTLYGKDNKSRIFDRSDADPTHPTRVFSWLICQSYDDKGNAVVYTYEEENSDNVDSIQAHERNRTPKSRSTNRYLKRIRYGNHRPNRDANWNATDASTLADWMFEVVFDYGEGHYKDVPLADGPEEAQHRFARAAASLPSGFLWPVRPDVFSSYRAGFEVRTYRRCQRVLMFHRFAELGPEPYLVRATEFQYDDLDYDTNPGVKVELAHEGSTRTASFIRAVIQSGFVKTTNQTPHEPGRPKYITYLKQSLPRLEFEYSRSTIQDDVRELDSESLANLPQGMDGRSYQWVDLDGEGVSGILTEQGDAWLYKPNLGHAEFGPAERVASIPSLAVLSSGRQQLLDLAGDGQLDLAQFGPPTPGFYERTDHQWSRFTPFASLPGIAWDDPNLRFVDLDGDGHADVLITEHEALAWHRSLSEHGFGSAERVRTARDEETGPRLVFADGTQSIYLADMSGDGLTDLARVRNGEVCYWPNLGYGRFGPKVTMDNAPWLDAPDQFDQGRVRLADIDGSGITDLIYLGRDTVQLYFNQSGNRWTGARALTALPRVDNATDVTATDLLGNGTACLVWSSPLPGDARRPVRYVDLMQRKPHLLVRVANNLGAETRVHYTSSTAFYLADKRAGTPWITRLPFPVHVVERVETFDWISRNRFVTRYAYHHGYFDGVEREFRGFGMVEQQDTEQFAALSASDDFPVGDNIAHHSHVPPVLTKTWFHTGVHPDSGHVSDFFAGLLDAEDPGEYYREPEFSDAEARALLLEDTVLPDGLTRAEERDACRALKGSMLRQEVYALDGTDRQSRPYSVTEQNFAIRRIQPADGNRRAVFFTHPRESISYHYERALSPVLNGEIVDEAATANPAVKRLPDPRVTHTLTLEIDEFGNVLKSAAAAYGRRFLDSRLPAQTDRDHQARPLITYTENVVTSVIDTADDYRAPLPCETRTYELTGYAQTGAGGRFQASDLVQTLNGQRTHRFDSEIGYEERATNGMQRRLIEHLRTLYRKNDLTSLLSLGAAESLALPGETYRLAFTPGLLARVYQRPREGQTPEALLPDPRSVLPIGGTADQVADRGGYVSSQDLRIQNLFPASAARSLWTRSDGDDHWWIPGGRIFQSANSGDASAAELAYARQHFFLPHRFRDPFHTAAARTESAITYDGYDLLVRETRDAFDNVVSVITTDDGGHSAARFDYRVLQPFWVTDANGNRTRVAFDALGLVVATAVMGKPGEERGDLLPDDYASDLTRAQISEFYDAADPHGPGVALLADATTRVVYDLNRHERTRAAYAQEPKRWQPAYAATVSRERHVSDELPPGALKVQLSFSYSDGAGREIQKKVQAEPGPAMDEGPILDPRWVGSGWTIFNNKGKPVRQYEPFFARASAHGHEFEFGASVGVSPILFYDPLERVVATLHPNHTWEKVVFDAWHQETWDVNDTVTRDPSTDADTKAFFRYADGSPRLPTAVYFPTWYALRTDPAHAAEAAARWPAAKIRDAERVAAEKAAAHELTPTTAYLDPMGRTFLTLAHNGFRPDKSPILLPTRVELDVEGNQEHVRDAERNGDLRGRIVMQYDHDMLANRIRQGSMDAGERWMLNDVMGKPIRAWDSRGHRTRTKYDRLRRPTAAYLAVDGAAEVQIGRTTYGETLVTPEDHNQRGKVVEACDQAGVLTTDDYDFKGNLLTSKRQLVSAYRATVDWSGVPAKETGTYASRTKYDALNRPIQLIAPHSDAARVNVVQPTYNAANLLEAVHVWLNRSAEPAAWLDPNTADMRAVTDIDYDAKGQRRLIEYGSGATTTYLYDNDTFRLIELKTTRAAGLNGLSGQLFSDPKTVQHLQYVYDPAGNIITIVDDAVPNIQYNNEDVVPGAEYTYDALYRLLTARGREHIGQTAFDFSPVDRSYRDYPFVGLRADPNDARAVRNYTESYVYDDVGNITSLGHLAKDATWTRTYAYQEPSLLESAKKNNRLTSTAVGGRLPEVFTYDAHGNITRMDHLPGGMQWDYRDQLWASAQQAVNSGTPEMTWYAYDAGGRRVRKVTDHASVAGQPRQRKEERIYLGGYEVYRRYKADGSPELERETLHVMDDKQRIAIVDTLTIDNGNAANNLVPVHRYQLGNHLGSASIELAEDGALISFEEYRPYGTSAFQAWRSLAEVRLKRYRYTGKERDEETGLSYHQNRFLMPWLGRWTSCDPAGLVDGPNLYAYGRNNPVRMIDTAGASAADPQKPSVFSRMWNYVVDLFGGKGKSSDNLVLGANEPYRPAIELAAERTDTDPATIAAIINAEAAPLSTNPAALSTVTDAEFNSRHPERGGAPLGKGDKELVKEWKAINKEMSRRWDPDSLNSETGAAGLTQFLKTTWLDEAKREGTYLNQQAKERGYVNEKNEVVSQTKLLELRSDPTISIVAAAEYDTQMLANLAASKGTGNQPSLVPENATAQEKAKLLYLVHHEGDVGAEQFLRGTLKESRAEKLLKANVPNDESREKLVEEHGDARAAYVAWLNAYIDKRIDLAPFQKVAP